MFDKTQELLMMFIKDGYKSTTGKVSRKTAITMMQYVAADPELSQMVNSSDWKGVLSHKSKED